MKKYFGKDMWPDTIYFAEVLPPDQQDKDEPETYITPVCGYETIKDKNEAPVYQNFFEDTNGFLTFSEMFNIFQLGKV